MIVCGSDVTIYTHHPAVLSWRSSEVWLYLVDKLRQMVIWHVRLLTIWLLTIFGKTHELLITKTGQILDNIRYSHNPMFSSQFNHKQGVHVLAFIDKSWQVTGVVLNRILILWLNGSYCKVKVLCTPLICNLVVHDIMRSVYEIVKMGFPKYITWTYAVQTNTQTQLLIKAPKVDLDLQGIYQCTVY